MEDEKKLEYQPPRLETVESRLIYTGNSSGDASQVIPDDDDPPF